MTLKAVLFDFDGVIVNTPEYYFKHMRIYLSKRNMRITDRDISNLIGYTFKEKLKYIRKKYKIKINRNHFVGEVSAGMKAELEKIVALDINLHMLLKELRRAKIKIGIASNNSPKTINFFLKKLGIKSYFSVIVTIRDVLHAKPSPETYVCAAKQLKLNCSDCVAIEDTVVGVRSAKSAGMKCIAMPNKFTSPHKFSMADMKVKSFRQITLRKLRGLVA